MLTESVDALEGAEAPELLLEAAAQKLTERVRNGEPVKVRVYDKLAPSQRTVVTPQRDTQRSHERATPARRHLVSQEPRNL
jgi:hypothetical protein